MYPALHHKTISVSIKKIYHRNAWHMGLYHKYDREIYQQLKKIKNSSYSKTFGCIYIPYNKEAYAEFKSLGIPYHIIPHQENQSRTRQSPLTSDISAIPHTGPMNEGRKLDADIQSGHGLNKITWQDSTFFISIHYSDAEIEFLKSLHGSYWNSKQKRWICKATFKNLSALQQRYHYWDEATLQKLKAHATAYSKRPKVIIKAVPADYTKLEVSISHASTVVEWIKTVPEREYIAESRSWLIPRDKQIVSRMMTLCDEHQYPVHQMFTWEAKMPLAKSRNGEKWLKVVLQGVPPAQLSIIKDYAMVFVREHYSYQTMKQYCGAFRRYLYSISELSAINTQTREDVVAYINTIAAQQVSYQELNRHVSAIKFYYEKIGGWSKMRLDQIKRPKRPKSLPYILSIEEVKRLLAQVKNPKHRCMLFLAYGCGLRSGEVVHLHVRDIMVDRSQIFIRGAKGKKDRVVMMPKRILPMLQIYMKAVRPDHWLFPGQDRTKPYTSSSLRNVFKRALSKAGLDPRHKLHNLRHSFATHLMERGTQQRLIQKLLGHSSSKTTEIYTQISKGSVTQVESPLDNLDLNDEKNGQI